MLAANGHPEAVEFIEQPHILRELRDIADRARRRAETERSIREGEPNTVPPGQTLKSIRGQCLRGRGNPVPTLIVEPQS
jgi:hypothetical protein